MTRAREIAFIDPSVSDLDTILGGLRPEVEAVVFVAQPAARQIATALRERQGIDAVHVIAHGAPGRVSFAPGDWSPHTLDADAEDFAAIGRALGDDGSLRLWSCCTGAGAAGSEFVAGLAQVTGAKIAAATARVGTAAFGGAWELAARSSATAAQPPLTAAGMVSYTGVLAAFDIIVMGTLPNGPTTGIVTYFIIDKTTGTIVGEIKLPDAAKQGNSVSRIIRVPIAADAYAIGIFIDGGDFQESSFLSVRRAPGPTGASGQI